MPQLTSATTRPTDDDWRLTRRTLLGTGTAGGVLAAGGLPRAALAQGSVPFEDQPNVTLTVNGTEVTLTIDPRLSLLDLLRERLDLTGAKKGCDHGQCGACTVHLDGNRVAACLTMAAQADGRTVTTIEGIAPGDALHPMQHAFIDHDALQCGYCTPGQIMAGIGCVREGHAGSDAQIREYVSGNLCRCGAYPGIVAAIRDAARLMQEG